MLKIKVEVEVSQSRPALCDLIDCSPARLLCPWGLSDKNTGVVIPFSRRFS